MNCIIDRAQQRRTKIQDPRKKIKEKQGPRMITIGRKKKEEKNGDKK